MQKKYIKLNKNEVSDIVSYLLDKNGLPKLVDRFNLYFFNNDNKELQIKFKNSQIYFKENRLNDAFGWVELKNRSIKSFFQTLDNLGFREFSCGRSKTLEFAISRGLTITIFRDSLKGPFSEIEYTTSDSEMFINDLANYSKLGDKRVYDTESFSKLPLTVDFKRERLFDSTGRLNKSIKDYCIQHGVEIRTDSLTLQSRLEGVSNDYSYLEESFKENSGVSLVDGNVADVWQSSYMSGVSVIIPSYNSHDKLEYTLRSINSQSLNENEFKMVEVIVVDDCSRVNTFDVIEKLRPNLKYQCKSAKFDQNMDVAFARNAGASMASYDNFVFLDSDILISKDYLKNMIYRLNSIPNAVFTSFRKNILLTDNTLLHIDEGLNSPDEIDDSRISNRTKSEQVGWDKNNKEIRQFDIFDDTDGFKNLGFGASIGVYDLPGVVSGHNIAVSRDNFCKTKGFCTQFQGWGMEDKFFGLNIILDGNFIIPVISSMVYHLEYGPRDGDLGRKISEVHENYERYKKRLGDIW